MNATYSKSSYTGIDGAQTVWIVSVIDPLTGGYVSHSYCNTEREACAVVASLRAAQASKVA